MTREDLATLLRDHVGHDEPAAMLPGPALAAGRRRLRLHRAVAAGAGLAAVVAAAALAGPLLTSPGAEGGSALDPASTRALADYDAHRMPVLMDEHVRAVLERSVPDLGPSTFHARDDQGQDLPERHWDKASSLSVAYGGRDHIWSVSISHARSEAEGNPEAYCADGLESGYYLECTVDRSDNGDVVISRVSALKPFRLQEDGWMAVTADQLERIDLDRLWFERTVKVIRSETLLTYATEYVKAVDRDPEGELVVPPEDLAAVGTDPELVMPPPPAGRNGCPAWTMQTDEVDISCE